MAANQHTGSMSGVLRLESVNNSPVVEYRAIDGHPVPFQVTIQRRTLTPDGDEYRDGASEWRTVTVGDVLDQLALGGPVADWLRNETRVDCTARRLLSYRDDRDASAYLWNVNALGVTGEEFVRIEALRAAAAKAGDQQQVTLAERALAGDTAAIRECRRLITRSDAGVRDIPFDEAQDVGSIDYRLAPIDVGFDLRAEGIPVQIRAVDDPIRVSYADAEGRRRVIEGPQRDVLRALEAHGYRFVIDGGQS